MKLKEAYKVKKFLVANLKRQQADLTLEKQSGDFVHGYFCALEDFIEQLQKISDKKQSGVFLK